MSATAFATACNHFDKLDAPYDADPEKQMIRFVTGTEIGPVPLAMLVDEHILQIIAHPGIKVPPGARGDIAKAITAINFGLKVGKFELDLSDGELRFQASTCLVEGDIDDEAIIVLMMGVLLTMQRYHNALMATIYGGDEPEAAIRLAEQAA